MYLAFEGWGNTMLSGGRALALDTREGAGKGIRSSATRRDNEASPRGCV